jgi:hypothetical protein
MKLDEFLRLAIYLNQLQEMFPGDQVWGELEQAIRDHLRRASKERPDLVMVPPSLDGWEEWCKPNERRLLSGENVIGTIFYPKPVMMENSSTVDGAVYCNAEITASPHTTIHGDLVSRKAIAWGGESVRSLIAPEIYLDQKVHRLDVSGSIVCRKLKLTPRGYLSGKIFGNLFVNEAIIDGMNKNISELTIGDGSKLGGIHVPCALLCGDRTVAGHIQSTFDVKLGTQCQISLVEGRNVIIGARSHIEQIYAEETVEIAEECCFRDVIAVGDIRVGRGCKVSRMMASLDGKILVEDPAWWDEQQPFHYKGNISALMNRKPISKISNGLAQSIILRTLQHTWYLSLKQIDPGWLSELVPVTDIGGSS